MREKLVLARDSIIQIILCIVLSIIYYMLSALQCYRPSVCLSVRHTSGSVKNN